MGTNINYDADFDVCKNEIGKIGDIDYGLVILGGRGGFAGAGVTGPRGS